MIHTNSRDENAPLLTSEVARLLNVSSDTVRLWERRGQLSATRTDHGVRLFSRAQVIAFAAKREEGGAAVSAA